MNFIKVNCNDLWAKHLGRRTVAQSFFTCVGRFLLPSDDAASVRRRPRRMRGPILLCFLALAFRLTEPCFVRLLIYLTCWPRQPLREVHRIFRICIRVDLCLHTSVWDALVHTTSPCSYQQSVKSHHCTLTEYCPFAQREIYFCISISYQKNFFSWCRHTHKRSK